MAYPPRINLPDLIYHVVNRGNNRQVIFVKESDYQHYLGMRYIEQNPLRSGMVGDLAEYPWSSFIVNTTAKKDPFIDKEENPAYLGLGSTENERSASYLGIATSVLEEDKLKEIRHTLTGKQHFISGRFEGQIKEKLSLAKPKSRGRPRKHR